MVGARVATDADADAVAALRQSARDDTVTKRGGEPFAATEGSAPGVDPSVDVSDAAVVLGLIGDTPVGVATVVRAATRARLTEIHTHPEARGVGVGHAMLGLVTDIARSWGCTDLDSFALPGDRDTKNFFESHAMKSRLLIVHQQL